MDKTIRRNEICVIGFPRCDFVFSSTRTCFIAYGFQESTLEMTILKNLLESKGIQPIEAGGTLAPGQNAYCAKICSKIITSQFSIVLLNNDEADGKEIPNANVNMEYGLMLGFNKYVIPFQKESQNLPFNIAGLDTVKYTKTDFERRASEAIDQAIQATEQTAVPSGSGDQTLQMLLLGRDLVFSPITDEGERNIFRLGEPLGFNLLNDFTGQKYVFFGRFASLRPELILWRIQKMNDILNGRLNSIPNRVKTGLITPEQETQATLLFEGLSLLVAVTSQAEKDTILEELSSKPINYPIELFCIDDIRDEVSQLPHNGTYQADSADA